MLLTVSILLRRQGVLAKPRRVVQDRLIHHILGVGLVCSRMARMFTARQLTAVMLSRMEGLVGNVDLDIYELSGEGLDLRGV